jgi:hypothetical protein
MQQYQFIHYIISFSGNLDATFSGEAPVLLCFLATAYRQEISSNIGAGEGSGSS